MQPSFASKAGSVVLGNLPHVIAAALIVLFCFGGNAWAQSSPPQLWGGSTGYRNLPDYLNQTEQQRQFDNWQLRNEIERQRMQDRQDQLNRQWIEDGRRHDAIMRDLLSR